MVDNSRYILGIDDYFPTAKYKVYLDQVKQIYCSIYVTDITLRPLVEVGRKYHVWHTGKRVSDHITEEDFRMLESTREYPVSFTYVDLADPAEGRRSYSRPIETPPDIKDVEKDRKSRVKKKEEEKELEREREAVAQKLKKEYEAREREESIEEEPEEDIDEQLPEPILDSGEDINQEASETDTESNEVQCMDGDIDSGDSEIINNGIEVEPIRDFIGEAQERMTWNPPGTDLIKNGKGVFVGKVGE